jgi:uncharacterized protein (DUF58 family)
MPKVTEFLTPGDLAKLASHQMLARQVVEGFCSGLHRSPHKGFSVEFKQHRQYVPGDEIRHLDWKVYGKTDRFYIREYEEETNLRCNILLDASGSMAYKGQDALYSKLDYSTRLAACLAYLMLHQIDSAGLVTFDTRVRKQIPPRSRPAHLQQMIDELADTQPGGETELGTVFQELVPKLKRRGLIVVVSDCFGDVPMLMKSLAQLRHARHEILIFQIWDKDELDFPFKQWTRFDCLEQASNKHMIDPAHLRASYIENLDRYREELKQGCYRHRIDLVPLTTDQPYADALGYFLAKRKHLG